MQIVQLERVVNEMIIEESPKRMFWGKIDKYIFEGLRVFGEAESKIKEQKKEIQIKQSIISPRKWVACK